MSAAVLLVAVLAAAETSTTAQATFDRAYASAHLRLEDLIKTEPPKVETEVACDFTQEPTGEGTPKLECKLKTGRVVKVKYGRGNPEIAAELAATWLMRRLGFGGDRMTLVKKLRCFGCPKDPSEYWNTAFSQREKLEPSRARVFESVAVEKKQEGKRVALRGVTLEEMLELPAATRAEKDAFLLMVVFLQHWDEIRANQRLVCLDKKECTRALAYIQDLGGSFGSWRAAYAAEDPRRAALSPRMNLETWRAEPIWLDRARCIVQKPSSSARNPVTFMISEAGRRIVADGLGALTKAEVENLFRRSAVQEIGLGKPSDWARVFLDKVAQLRAARCPTP